MDPFTAAKVLTRINPSDIELPPTEPIQIVGWLSDGDRAPSLAASAGR